MKRKIAIYVVLIATILGAAPYLTGMLVEAKFHDVVNLVSHIDTLPAKVSVIEYHRGWRTSSAKTEVIIYSDRTNTVKEYRLILEHDIRHGPFVQLQAGNYRDWEFARALIHSTLQLTPEAEKILLQEVGQTNLFIINSVFAMNGAVDVRIEGPELKLKEHENTGRVAFKGMSGKWTINPEMNQIEGKMVLPGMDFDLGDVHFFAGNLQYRSQWNASLQGLWPGDFSATLEKLSMASSSKMNLTLEGLSTRGAILINGDNADLTGMCHIEKLSLNDKVYGPIDYSNTLRHMDANVLKTFLSLNHQIKTGDVAAKTKMFQFLLSMLPDFLKSRPEFTIDKCYVHSQEGDLNGQLYFAVGGVEANNISNMPQVIRSIVAKGDLLIPKTMLRDLLIFKYQQDAKQANATTAEQTADQVIAQWLQETRLIAKDQYYVINLEFKNAKFLVNSREMQLPEPQQLR